MQLSRQLIIFLLFCVSAVSETPHAFGPIFVTKLNGNTVTTGTGTLTLGNLTLDVAALNTALAAKTTNAAAAITGGTATIAGVQLYPRGGEPVPTGPYINNGDNDTYGPITLGSVNGVQIRGGLLSADAPFSIRGFNGISLFPYAAGLKLYSEDGGAFVAFSCPTSGIFSLTGATPTSPTKLRIISSGGVPVDITASDDGTLHGTPVTP